MNGDTTNAKTETLLVVPNKSDPLKSLLIGASTPLTIDDDHTFNFQIFDSFSNPIIVPVYILAHLKGVG